MTEIQTGERVFSQQLPELARFSEPAIMPGEAMDTALATSTHSINILVTPESLDAALAYQYVLGRDDLKISVDQNPIATTMANPQTDGVQLVMHSATDKVLNQRMFRDGPDFGQLLMGHVYTPSESHESPTVHCVGATRQSLDLLAQSAGMPEASVTEDIAQRRRALFGDSVSNTDFRRILQSDSVPFIRAHALGPEGTNISQAMRQYVASLSIEGKTDIVVHNGTEPREYAQLAREDLENGILPIHMECAVFYDMLALFSERPDEVVFADHHDMLLDTMQLASVEPIDVLANRGVMRIATHPSPRPLIDPWVNAGKAEWVKATSNAEAAQMAADFNAGNNPSKRIDACITTGSGLANTPGLKTRHVHGRPNMLFTIGTSLNQTQMRELLKAI